MIQNLDVREFLSAIFLGVIGLLFCIGGLSVGIGSLASPGEGFLPLVAGATLLLLSLAFAIQRFSGKGPRRDVKSFWPEAKSKLRVAYVLGAILIYVAVFEWMGFALATFILFLFLLKTIDPVSWPNAFLLSFLVTLFGFFLFQVWLHVQLPEGWISWWRISRWIS